MSKGIAVHVSDSRAAYLTPGVGEKLWVVYDWQFQDAVSLLKNKNHIVKRPISKGDIEKLKIEFEKSFSHLFEKALNFIMVAIIAVFIGLVGFCVYYLGK